MIVPFFGDQFTWAAAVKKAHVGIAPSTIDEINAVILIESFEVLKSETLRRNAESMREKMETEHGNQDAVRHLYETLQL